MATRRFEVKVMPRSGRPGVQPAGAGSLVVRVSAPPVDGQANAAVIAALADYFRCPKRLIRIVRGETSRRKVVEVATE